MDTDTQTPTTTEPAGTAPPEKVTLEAVASAENEAVQKAMLQVTALVDGIAKAAGVPDPEPEPDPATVSDDDVEKAGGEARKAAEGALKAAGVKGDDLTKAMADFDKRFGAGPGKTDAKPPLSKTKKAADAEPEEDAPTVLTVDETIEATLDTIQKAKAFTPGRVAKLESALETLQKLLLEVIAPNASPATKVPAVPVHPNPNTTRAALAGDDKKPVLKAGGPVEELAASVIKLQEALGDRDKKTAEGLADVAKRLEDIEKTRVAPSSVDDDGVTDSTTKKAFWNGLL
jgi:hypothetical protein